MLLQLNKTDSWAFNMHLLWGKMSESDFGSPIMESTHGYKLRYFYVTENFTESRLSC